MTIVELNAKGAIILPETLECRRNQVRYFQLAETKKGLVLTPVTIKPARTTG
ncbi:hypothetical protein [Cerasicoccus fimbriatus]|uniref:hypothetical protein n=1 Tax=Cerasicoccus fimbriatus TaxID=3014554 RepID=UPI0022B3A0F2|nr:hypothetical protein [Cerasicoccus sp. TK19100]